MVPYCCTGLKNAAKYTPVTLTGTVKIKPAFVRYFPVNDVGSNKPAMSVFILFLRILN